jgi:hypothetical protein
MSSGGMVRHAALHGAYDDSSFSTFSSIPESI